jgi:hypothetical protein
MVESLSKPSVEVIGCWLLDNCARLCRKARCVKVVQTAAAEIGKMTVPAAIRGPAQGADEGARGLKGDASRMASVVLVSVDTGGSESIAKTYP